MPASVVINAGHTDSVLCCEVLHAKKLLASGGEDGAICFTDLATLKPVGRVVQGLGDAVPSLCCHPAEEHTLFAATGSAVLQLDLRQALDGSAAVCRTFGVNADEVNCIAASAANGGWLAAGDDAGEVQVISLQQQAAAAAAATGGSQQQAGQDAAAAAADIPAPVRPAAYKTLRRGHSNICAAVAFRPHRPWEVLSGGLDATVVKWDFSRLRPLQNWNLNGEATASGGQLFNPPMVHSIAVPQCDDRALCRLMAVGRGDGSISVYDADWKPAAAAAAAAGGSKKGGGKAAARQRGSGGGQAAAALHAQQASVPGRLALLGPEQGGHTAAVNCVTFTHSSGCQQLLSAGNDCRLLLWNWRAPQAAGQEAAAAAEHQQAGDGGDDASTASGSGGMRQGGEIGDEAAGGTGSSEVAGPLLAAQHKHARKINWACSADVAGCDYSVFLADTGHRLTALTLL